MERSRTELWWQLLERSRTEFRRLVRVTRLADLRPPVPLAGGLPYIAAMMVGLLCLLLPRTLLGDSWGTPGILGRQGQRWYRDAVDRRHRGEQDLATVDVAVFRRPWSDSARKRLDAIDLLEGWEGGDLDAQRDVTRWEMAFLFGRFVMVVSPRIGRLADTRLDGPRRVVTPRNRWGDRVVRLAVRSGLFPAASSAEWWDETVSRGRFARLLNELLNRVETRTPVLELPLTFPPPGSGLGIPLQGDPRWPVLRRIHRAGVVDMGIPDWGVRDSVPLFEALLAFSRLVFIAEGYREPPLPPRPEPVYPVADTP